MRDEWVRPLIVAYDKIVREQAFFRKSSGSYEGLVHGGTPVVFAAGWVGVKLRAGPVRSWPHRLRAVRYNLSTRI